MNVLSKLAVPAAIALFMATASSVVAQDKPSNAAASKPTQGSTSSKKAVRPTWQGPTSLKSSTSKPAAESIGTQQSTPEAARAGKAAGEGYKSCHGKDSDA